MRRIFRLGFYGGHEREGLSSGPATARECQRVL